MKKLTISLLGFFAFVCFVVSCGSDDNGRSVPTTMEATMQELIKITCGKMIECSSEEEKEIAGEALSSVDNCIDLMEDSEDEPSNCTFHADKVDACLSCFRGVTCEEFIEATLSEDDSPGKCDAQCIAVCPE